MSELIQSEECELSLCATILAHNEAYFEASQVCEPEHFTHPLMRNIYAAVGSLIAEGRAATTASLQRYFDANQPAGELGGAILETLVDGFYIHRGAARDLAKEIKATFLRRQLINFGKRLVENASTFEVGDDIDEDIMVAQAELMDIQGGTKEQKFTKANDAAWDTLERIQQAWKADQSGEIVGIPTGLDPLDNHLAGLLRSGLYVLAGATSMGKSALASTVSKHVAELGEPVLFVTQEMPTEQVMQRLFAAETGITVRAQQTGKVSNEDVKQLAAVATTLAELPLYCLDTPGASVAMVQAVAAQLNRINKLGLIVIDYLQLLDSGSTNKYESRTAEVGKISRGLKALAMQLDCPVLALAQLSRAVDARDDHRPRLSDLRESGTIEQDADVVMFIMRQEKYLRDSPPPSSADEITQANYATKLMLETGRADLLIAKNRHGPLGEVELGFEAGRMRFLSQRHAPGSQSDDLDIFAGAE